MVSVGHLVCRSGNWPSKAVLALKSVMRGGYVVTFVAFPGSHDVSFGPFLLSLVSVFRGLGIECLSVVQVLFGK